MQDRDEFSGGGARNAKRKSSNIRCCLHRRDVYTKIYIILET
jgi:hypothetical protein